MEFKHIDLSMLEALYKDKPERMKQITKKYADTISELTDKLNQSVKKGQKDVQKNTAHSLKTAFKYLGMEELSVTARKVEALAQKGDESIEEHAKQISDQWEQAKVEVDKFVNS
jgi:HPt (histidine-containing phosphotransfer) domain-containing protein